MVTHGDVTVTTALGTTGVETSIGTVVMSAKGKRIVGFWVNPFGAATLTTGQPITGFFRVDSGDINIAPSKWPLPTGDILTSGAFGLTQQIIPVDIAIKGLETLTFLVTIDLTNTGALKARCGVIYEGD